MYGKRDAQAEFTSYFNDATDQVHEALKGLPRTDVHTMYLRGSGLGREAYSLVGKQANYDPTRGDDGSLLFGSSFLSSGFGADWGHQVTAGKVTHSTGTTVASVDLGTGSVAFGFQAYLQVFAFTGTSATVTLQGSSDNAVGDPFAAITGGAFTAVTARGAQRIQSASDTLSVERYVRVVTTGTFSNLVFAVAFTRNNAQRAI